jgi:hypothetical protein
VTDAARLLLHVLTLAAGLAIGWGARGWHDGSTVTAATADAVAQASVAAGTDAAVSIDRAQGATDKAVERVRTVRVPVAVAPECPPGEGAMSAEMDAKVREALR